LLPYEQAVTRQVPRREGWYNLGTHFPWVGLRTAEIDGAHVDYFRGIRNPIGVKIGPGMTPEWLLDLLEILDPDAEPGRITLIHRMGHDKVADKLPQLIEAVQNAGRLVLWCCDPMHGNTEKTASASVAPAACPRLTSNAPTSHAWIRGSITSSPSRWRSSSAARSRR
jgi:3-deoxy-7-phosphoheptulonate synthase